MKSKRKIKIEERLWKLTKRKKNKLNKQKKKKDQIKNEKLLVQNK